MAGCGKEGDQEGGEGACPTGWAPATEFIASLARCWAALLHSFPSVSSKLRSLPPFWKDL